MKNKRQKILVKGIVQGVGFRPFVFSLAQSLNLKGFVVNSSDGVIIEIEGKNSFLFLERLKAEAPPLSEIMDIEITPLHYHGYKNFQIMESKDEGSFTLISTDVSLCDDCFRELLDKHDRRYLYPFINCTNCGPRYTITESLPYDRPNTTMSVFKMCADCEREYNDPVNRRFHAQPNACPVCGPHVELVMKNEDTSSLHTDTDINKDQVPSDEMSSSHEHSNLLERTIHLLKEGNIIAIKGLGGFHIACDATNSQAVERLRLKKRRSNKPFALMAPSIDTIRKFCEVSEEEEVLLTSVKRPIVLLNKRQNSLPEAVSPHNPYFGVMLPYTPLHYLLFYYPLTKSLSRKKPRDSAHSDSHFSDPPDHTPHFDALIMTSGNISEEPIVIDNEEALLKLSDTADAFLIHNRDIFMRVDDTVLRLLCVNTDVSHNIQPCSHDFCIPTYGRPVHSSQSCYLSFIRRSRGYVPDPIPLYDDGPDVLGCGSDIKNTFTLTKAQFAIPSQHIGDMENYETLTFFEESLRNLREVYRVKPVALAHDLHPDYLSTQWALRQEGMKKIAIQHHHAHIASVMAEKCIKNKVIGVSFDGTGYGTDGTLWGGEILITDVIGFKRAGHFKYIPLPGGEMSIKEPWRIAISYIRNTAGTDTVEYLKSIGFIDRYGEKKIEDILKIVDISTYSPLTSSAGRLFDAVSALLGICDKNTFEGEAAIALESLTLPDIREDYPLDIKFRDIMEIDFSQTIFYIIRDFLKGESTGIISSKFHNTLVTAILRVVQKLSSINMITDVVLCGGVFQNMYLLERAIVQLQSIGMNVHIHEKVPSNDAGISLGQAYIIREMIKRGTVGADRKNIL
jgi:hydrogenase maturation protein HypF